MNIELHAPGMKLPRARTQDLKQRLRETFQHLGVSLVRVVVRAAGTAKRRAAARECVLEVHMDDGTVTLVTERQRHLGALLRRAVDRAWSAVAPVRAPIPPARARIATVQAHRGPYRHV